MKNADYLYEISFVIVCMNNLKNLYRCLDSIKQYTIIRYEVLVVAYLFDKANFEKVKSDYPWVSFIESSEIRGFSENNNMALKIAKGKYCFVLNDDTELRMPVADKLVETINTLPDNVAVVSPRIINPNGRILDCGVNPKNWVDCVKENFYMWKRNHPSQYINQKGIFRSYNIIGAAFLIKSDVFEKVGWFDERFFFCPEDIVLSTLLNKKGYECWVNADVELIHYEGMSSKSFSMIQTATNPAAAKGSLIYFGDTKFRKICLQLSSIPLYLARLIVFGIKAQLSVKPNEAYIKSLCAQHNLYAIFSSESPKELFKRYYNEINQKKA